MKIESLNCPNCGAGVTSDKTECFYCHTRLKTEACMRCFGLNFIGAKHCSHCGMSTVEAEVERGVAKGNCPKCARPLTLLRIGETSFRECTTCAGLWADVATIEEISANSERQATVSAYFSENPAQSAPEKSIKYVPCPDCGTLMNRTNFARSSGVVIDHCKGHGMWFDAEELPRIIEFIRSGGLDRQREKEKSRLEMLKRENRSDARLIAMREARLRDAEDAGGGSVTAAVREFVRYLLD